MTLRQLVWMAEGKQRENWNHTSSVLAVIVNAFRGKNDPAISPQEINPFTAKSGVQTKPNRVMGKMSEIKGFFTKGK